MRYLEPISTFELIEFDPLREKRAEQRLASRLRKRRSQLLRCARNPFARTLAVLFTQSFVSAAVTFALLASLVGVLARP